MNIANKIEYLDSLTDSSINNEQLNTVIELSHDSDVEVRYRVSELLGVYVSDVSEKILLNLITDDNYLVRASACDSLSWSCSVTVLNALMKATKDINELVRGYSILSLADVKRNIYGNNTQEIKLLEQLFVKEKSDWVRIALYRSLILLGNKSYQNIFLKQIDHENYKNRSFTLNLLEDLLDKSIIETTTDLYKTLHKAYEKECTIAVKEKLLKLIENKII